MFNKPKTNSNNNKIRINTSKITKKKKAMSYFNP